jgi:hypothetical protein
MMIGGAFVFVCVCFCHCLLLFDDKQQVKVPCTLPVCKPLCLAAANQLTVPVAVPAIAASAVFVAVFFTPHLDGQHQHLKLHVPATASSSHALMPAAGRCAALLAFGDNADRLLVCGCSSYSYCVACIFETGFVVER